MHTSFGEKRRVVYDPIQSTNASMYNRIQTPTALLSEPELTPYRSYIIPITVIIK